MPERTPPPRRVLAFAGGLVVAYTVGAPLAIYLAYGVEWLACYATSFHADIATICAGEPFARWHNAALVGLLCGLLHGGAGLISARYDR